MKIITTREKYDATAKGEPFFAKRKGNLRRKSGPDPNTPEGRWRLADATRDAVDIFNEHSGEIQTREKWEYRAGCPVSHGNIVTLRFKDGGKSRGRLAVMVTGIVPLDDGRWLIRMERAGIKHRPIPADDRNFYLAPTAGYTSNASRALDPEAATMDPKDAARVMRDMQIHRTASKGAPLELPPADETPLTDEERAERMNAIADELAA